MTKVGCSKADCTIGTTGKCLEAHAPLETCPFYLKEMVSDVDDPNPRQEQIESPSDETTESDSGRDFPAGLELGYADVLSVSRSRYMHVVAVLGPTNAGKTCLLVSLYLLALNRMLSPQFRFAGSRTLMGFEHRARGLRKWDQGALPAEFADHTRLGDPRAPAFMHIAFDEDQDSSKHREFLFTDLPGEWTTDLIDRTETASRFQFLSRADAVVVVLDGPRLAGADTRQQEIMQAEHLLQRLVETVKLPLTTRIIFVVSKFDELTANRADLAAQVQKCADEYGFQTVVIETAAISREPNRVPNGHGMCRLLQVILQPPPTRSDAVSESKSTPRSMHDFERARRIR